MTDLGPPVIAGPAQGIPGIDHDLVEGVLHQAGKVCGGGQLDAVRAVPAMQVIVPGEHHVELTDAGEVVGLEAFEVGRHAGRRASRLWLPGAGPGYRTYR